ncbi:MAG: hypothetical protein ACRD1J_04785 [Terriglobia bacterium]
MTDLDETMETGGKDETVFSVAAPSRRQAVTVKVDPLVAQRSPYNAAAFVFFNQQPQSLP